MAELLSIPAQLDLDYNYSELSDIVQLDGPADNSDIEEEERVPLEENDFLGIINAEAIKALQEGDGSSDGNSISSGSDSEGADELANVEEEVRGSEFDMHFVMVYFLPLKHVCTADLRLLFLEMTFISRVLQAARLPPAGLLIAHLSSLFSVD